MQDHSPRLGVRQCRARRLRSSSPYTRHTEHVTHHAPALRAAAALGPDGIFHTHTPTQRPPAFQQHAPPSPGRRDAESKSLRVGITVAADFSHDTAQLGDPLWFDVFVIVSEPIVLATSSNTRVQTPKPFTSLSIVSRRSRSPISSMSRTTRESGGPPCPSSTARHSSRLASPCQTRSPSSRFYIPLHWVTLRTSRRFQPRRLGGTQWTTRWFHRRRSCHIPLAARKSLQGHRNHPRHSRRACRRSF